MNNIFKVEELTLLKGNTAILSELHTLIKKYISDKGFSDEILHGWPMSSEEPLIDQQYERQYAIMAEDEILSNQNWKRKIMESGGALALWDEACMDVFGVESKYIKKYCYIREHEYAMKGLLLQFHEKEVDSALNKIIEEIFSNIIKESAEHILTKIENAITKAFPEKEKDILSCKTKEAVKSFLIREIVKTKSSKDLAGIYRFFPYNTFWNNLSNQFFGIEFFGIEFTELRKFKGEYDKYLELNKTAKQVPSDMLSALKLALGEKIQVHAAPRKSTHTEQSLNLENKMIEIFLKVNDRDKIKFIESIDKRMTSKGLWGDVLKEATGFWGRRSVSSEMNNTHIRVEDAFRIFWRILCLCDHYIDLGTKPCTSCEDVVKTDNSKLPRPSRWEEKREGPKLTETLSEDKQSSDSLISKKKLSNKKMNCPYCDAKLPYILCLNCGGETPEKSRYCCWCRNPIKVKEREIDTSERILCSDGSCIGIINQEGICNVCKKPFSGEGLKSNF